MFSGVELVSHCVGVPETMVKRTRGCVMEQSKVHDMFNSHIKVSGCAPQDLFKWSDVKANSQIISAILDLSGGRIPWQELCTNNCALASQKENDGDHG